MRERVVTIGAEAPLVGILSEPAEIAAGAPAVLLLNAGVMHRVGTCRTSVRIARALAAEGVLALRFDRSGVGDSPARRLADTAVGADLSVAETLEVMQYLEATRGVRRFILYGLCSGANAAIAAAALDERVVGIAAVDPHPYETLRYRWIHYMQRMREGRVRSRMRRLLRLRRAGRRRDVSPEFFEMPEFPGRPDRRVVADRLRALVRRSVRMYIAFTGGAMAYNYPTQYRDCFRDVDFGELLRLEYHPDSDHIMTPEAAQRAVCEGVVALARELAPATR